MLEHYPVRRDPRVLLVLEERGQLTFAALDAWEIRGVGSLPRTSIALHLALTRALLQTRPSALVAHLPRARLRSIVDAAARIQGLHVLHLDAARFALLNTKRIEPAQLAGQYREICGLTDPRHLRALGFAAAALAHLPLPSRFYVASRKPPCPASSVVSARSRRSRAPRLSHRASARCARRVRTRRR